jgi:hypothetical protein
VCADVTLKMVDDDISVFSLCGRDNSTHPLSEVGSVGSIL